MTRRRQVLNDISEELAMFIFTLDMAHDLEDGGGSAITSDLLNSQLFIEICSSDFNEYEDAKGDWMVFCPKNKVTTVQQYLGYFRLSYSKL